MADVSHLLKSDYLNGEELSTTPRIFTIKGTEIVTFDDGQEKVVLSFNETDKALPCNKTRLKTMVSEFGAETGAWAGQQVMLYGQQLVSGKFAGQWSVILAKAPEQAANGQKPDPVAF